MTPTRQQQKRENTESIKRGLPNDAIVGELERITDAVESLKNDMQMMCELMGEMCTHMKEMSLKEYPEMPEFPEIPKTDLTETNTLLTALLEEEQKPEEPIKVTLQLE